jgi:hypothetical protein
MEFQKSRFAKLAGIGEDSHAAPAEESRLDHDQVLKESSDAFGVSDLSFSLDNTTYQIGRHGAAVHKKNSHQWRRLDPGQEVTVVGWEEAMDSGYLTIELEIDGEVDWFLPCFQSKVHELLNQMIRESSDDSDYSDDSDDSDYSDYPMMNDIADEYLAALQQTGSRQIPWMRYIRTTVDVDEFGDGTNRISAEHGHIPSNHLERSAEYWAWLRASEDVIERFNDDFLGIEFGIHSGGLR